MNQHHSAKTFAGLGTAAAATIFAMALATSSVMAQDKGGGGSPTTVAPGGGSKGGGPSVSGRNQGERSKSGGGDQGSAKSGDRNKGDRSSNRSSERRGRDGGHAYRRGGPDVNIGVYGYSGYSDECSYFHQRAVATGSRYWWRRYRACID